jgi:polar amino acid transport system substrate-binding protein
MMTSVAMSEEILTLYYYERPPFLAYQANEGVTGSIGNRVTDLFLKAGITVSWQLLPAKRQLNLLRMEAANACGVGWYRNEQRAAFAQFSHPIYRDRGTVVIARLPTAATQDKTLAGLLQEQSILLLLKDGLTYGKRVARMIQAAKSRIEEVTVGQREMVRMIANGRANMMFATREEADMLLKGQEWGAAGPQLLTFPDLPAAGEPRYLMCGGGVSRDTMAAINNAIDAVR